MRQQIAVVVVTGLLIALLLALWVVALPFTPDVRPLARVTLMPPATPLPVETPTPVPTMPASTPMPTPTPQPTPRPTIAPTQPVPTLRPPATPTPPLFLEVIRPGNRQVLRGADPQVEVAGKTLPWSFVEIFYHSSESEQRMRPVRADANGDFTGLIPLREGVNVLEIVSSDNSSDQKVRLFSQVTYDPGPLVMTVRISKPANGANVRDAVIMVSGTTLPDARVVLNGVIPAPADGAGQWQADILLQIGRNEIVAVASKGDDKAEMTITVTYTP